MSKQMVRRWCRTFSDGRQQVEDISRAGWTRTTTTDANVGKVDDMIRANRRITIDEVAEEFGISHERAQNIIHDILRYRKVIMVVMCVVLLPLQEVEMRPNSRARRHSDDLLTLKIPQDFIPNLLEIVLGSLGLRDGLLRAFPKK
ncbi:uncharacterized protein TNIN_161821 [Trichonephila inaurata madagascariensis]|uniref:Transposase n=1 Tax=Trichonephila inaurata madagascariensis TaxID=2747483 RepID=A0A8X6YPA2_9ARAC|nr:uncharacterized protein TNIN_161821 [Trichonephila inaurata madagascariensis]